MAKKKTKSKSAKQSTAAKQTSITDSINNEVIAAALSSVNQPVLMKVCRLCETKDGPFLNIFDAEKVTAKKIEELMPFWIAENDDLPHKICFRCSAKVEELYEFIQKCVKTQNSLRTAIGKTGPLATKTKTRTMWEQKLNKTNMTNDDICDALIKKAMEGIKDIPLNHLPLEDEKSPPSPPPVAKKIKSESSVVVTKKEKDIKNNVEEPDIPLKQLKLSIEKIDQKAPVTRNSRANNSEVLLEGLGTAISKKSINKQPTGSTKKPQNKVQDEHIEKVTSLSVEIKEKSTSEVRHNEDSINKPYTSVEIKEKSKSNVSVDEEDSTDIIISKDSKHLDQKVQVNSKQIASFNIMDHVSTIKVNGVGILFQCKLCNRNFLKKEVVISHGCAKNGVPRVDFTKHVPPPEPPKAPTVKYIKIDDEFKKALVTEHSKTDTQNKTKSSENLNIPSPVSEVKPKPKIGPASKVKREAIISKPQTLFQKEPSPPPPSEKLPNIVQNTLLPSVHFPSMPSLNSRYKLVPGPNNTFTLVEEPSLVENKAVEVNSSRTKIDKKRKVSDDLKKSVDTKPKDLKQNNFVTVPSPEVIDLEELTPSQPAAVEQPYPVGLFQTVPHHSSIYVPPVVPQPQIFTTPAMKKQSYTIVQTGNPSKLLISTKPQPQPAVEEIPRKRQKKVKPDAKDTSKDPFTVTLEDNAPPKDAGFFTFINVDPLLQPSYVLPTHNIIQESQISTSTPIVQGASDNKDKEKYTCNMCGEKFSREKKLLSHIQSHYSKMDEEDQLRAEKNTKKRGRKS